MKIQQKMFVTFLIFGLILWCPPPTKARHNKVRIHVPTNVRTVYKTKIVKVPQHHHYFHEKIKEVPKFIPLPNHYDLHHHHYDNHDHHEPHDHRVHRDHNDFHDHYAPHHDRYAPHHDGYEPYDNYDRHTSRYRYEGY